MKTHFVKTSFHNKLLLKSYNEHWRVKKYYSLKLVLGMVFLNYNILQNINV